MRPRALLLPAAPVLYVALVALANLTGSALGSVLQEFIIVAGFVTSIVALYLWIDRAALRKQLDDALADKHGLEQVVARKASLETDLEVTSAVRELALVAGNTNDLDKALAASSKLVHDLVHDNSGNRHGVEVAIFLSDPKGGRPALKVVANSAGPRTGRRARVRDLVGSIPEGGLAGACDGEHNPPLVRGGRAVMLVPLEGSKGPLGALYVGLPFADEEPEELLARLGQLLRVFCSHIAHAVQKFALYDEATLDALTGLLTKRQYLLRLKEEAETAQQGRSLSLLVCDLDHFKNVNDTYGHATGDVVLKRVANLISKLIRPDDLAFRFGGEEMVVMTDQDLAGATLLAERLRVATSELAIKSAKGESIQMSASFGVATFEEGMENGDELFVRADKAVYKSKEDGRNRVSIWTPRGIIAAAESGFLNGESPRRAASA